MEFIGKSFRVTILHFYIHFAALGIHRCFHVEIDFRLLLHQGFGPLGPRTPVGIHRGTFILNPVKRALGETYIPCLLQQSRAPFSTIVRFRFRIMALMNGNNIKPIPSCLLNRGCHGCPIRTIATTDTGILFKQYRLLLDLCGNGLRLKRCYDA